MTNPDERPFELITAEDLTKPRGMLCLLVTNKSAQELEAELLALYTAAAPAAEGPMSIEAMDEVEAAEQAYKKKFRQRLHQLESFLAAVGEQVDRAYAGLRAAREDDREAACDEFLAAFGIKKDRHLPRKRDFQLLWEYVEELGTGVCLALFVRPAALPELIEKGVVDRTLLDLKDGKLNVPLKDQREALDRLRQKYFLPGETGWTAMRMRIVRARHRWAERIPDWKRLPIPSGEEAPLKDRVVGHKERLLISRWRKP